MSVNCDVFSSFSFFLDVPWIAFLRRRRGWRWLVSSSSSSLRVLDKSYAWCHEKERSVFKMFDEQENGMWQPTVRGEGIYTNDWTESEGKVRRMNEKKSLTLFYIIDYDSRVDFCNQFYSVWIIHAIWCHSLLALLVVDSWYIVMTYDDLRVIKKSCEYKANCTRAGSSLND